MPSCPNPSARRPSARLGVAAALVSVAALGCSDNTAAPAGEPAACFDYGSTPQFVGSVASRDIAREILVDGSLVYVANPAIGVLAYDVSDPHAPHLVGQYSSLGRIDALAQQGNLLLATAEQSRRLLVLDATTPAGLSLLGFVGFQSRPHAVVTRGQHAFVTTFEFTDDQALHVVDFSTPTAPYIASTTRLEGTPFDLAIKDAALYIVTASEPNDYLLYDVTVPTTPRLAGVLQTPGPGVNFVVAGNHGYAADGDRGVQIFDLSSALSPRWIATYAASLHALQVQVAGTLAFVYRRPFVEVADVSNPRRPRRLGTMWLDLDAYAADLQSLYFWMKEAFHVQDFSNPKFASIAARVDLTTPTNIELVGSLAYVTAQNRLEILDVSQAEPAPVGSVLFGSGLLALAVTDSTAYVGDASGVIHVVDVSRAASARPVGSVAVGDDVLDLALHGTRVYALERRFGLRVIDASAPAAPQLAGSLGVGLYGLALVAAEDIVCIDAGDGVRIIDASVPSAPVQVGEIQEPAIHAIAMRDMLLYIATQEGLAVYDLTNAAAPGLASRQSGWPNWARAESLAFDTSYLYVISGLGVRVFDLADAAAPAYVGFFDLDRGEATDAASDGRHLYLTTTHGVDVLPAGCPAALF